MYDQEEIKRMARDYFSELFTTSNPMGLEEVMEAVDYKVESKMDSFLNLPFTSMEIKEALFQIGPAKVPGPDGMPVFFFQKY